MTAVEKDLVRARKMTKDLLDERVMVNAESEQKRENLNVSMIIVFEGHWRSMYDMHWCTPLCRKS